MRVWLTAAANRSSSGTQIWRQRVVNGTLRRTPALRLSFAQAMIRFLVEQDGIQFPANAITIPEERANRHLVRIVKGLLTQFHPQFDTDGLSYVIAGKKALRKSFWSSVRQAVLPSYAFGSR